MAEENLFINGALGGDFWNRLDLPIEEKECPVWAQTFAADRWKIRYARPVGQGVRQRRSVETPVPWGETSVEIVGGEGVSESVFFGQRIEAAEAPRYRRRLRFSARVYFWKGEGARASRYPVHLVVGYANERNRFGNAFNSHVTPVLRESISCLIHGEWVLLEGEVDASRVPATGLSVELEFPGAALSHPGSKIRVADLQLVNAGCRGRLDDRPAWLERGMAQRFFQRHDAERRAIIGRALSISADEILFQFSFPEMAQPPSCTLPHRDGEGEGCLRVVPFRSSHSSQPSDVYGFTYQPIQITRSDMVIRAMKERHGLSDAYLYFKQPGAGAILLDSEL